MIKWIHVSLSIFAVLLVLAASPMSAQEGASAPVEYPTVAALDAETIPPRDRVQLARELLGIGIIAPPPTAPPAYALGDRETFHVTNSSEDLAFEVDAVLRAVGDHIYLWVEADVQVDQGSLKALALAFDQRIYDETRRLWGSEDIPGIDGDPRVYGLFVRNLGAGTAAYFVSEHTYPVEAVSTSNEHEMFFFNLDSLGTTFDVRYVEGVVAHEFQHMIRNEVQLNEEYWINEGFSEFTQLYLYDTPVWEILSFLNAPGTQLNSWAEEPGTRPQNYGASLLFTTYFYDRYGLDALQQLSADPSIRGFEGVDNVLRAMGEPGVDDFFADWVIANFLFNTSVGDGRYGYASIRDGVLSATAAETVTEYPYAADRSVNQYATDYVTLANLDDADTLTIQVTAPVTAPLVQENAYSGQRMWYSNKADVSSTTLTRAFDLSGVDSATLSYHVWYHTEQFWDYGYVMASDDGGVTWDILATDNTTTENPHNTAYGAGYTGVSGGWVSETVSLDAYAGGEVLVRFQSITDDAVTRPGLLVDDVGISEIDYFSDFESDGGGWDAEGWVWIDNILPQQVWVQAVQQTVSDATVTRWQAPAASTWTLPLEPGVELVTLAISPFAPVTTVPMNYTLEVSAD